MHLLSRAAPRPRACTTWSRVFCAGLCGGLLCGVSTAQAATTVSGELDTNAPLEIAPSSDPLAADLDLAGWRAVAFIQTMPVTKTIDRVTIGDLGRSDRCTGDAKSQVVVREHSAGNLTSNDGSFPYTQLAASPSYETIDSTLSRRTWTIPPTKLRAGRGYSFLLTWHTDFCRYVKQRSWAHNRPQVNAGPLTCAPEPLLGQTASPPGHRMWHQQGANDRHPACVTNGYSERDFHPSMPSGWLATVSYNGRDHYVAGDTHYAGSPHQQCGSEAQFGQTGAEELFWRLLPNYSPATEQYVCSFGQYGPPGEEMPDGWYYGLPWRKERNGAPRDVYLRLDTIDYDQLLLRHSPVLAYDSEEDFHALSPGAATDFFDQSDDPDDPEDSNQLKDQIGTFATANFGIAIENQLDGLHLGYLDSDYTGVSRRNGSDSTSEDFISLRGDGSTGPGGVGFSSDGYDSDAAAMEALPGYANRVYGRATHGGDGRLWLQYWLYYYYYDSQRQFYGGEHEGDWEMVQVRLLDSGARAPDKVAYAQHDSGEFCDWPVGTKDGDHPVIYVAKASHASYWQPGVFAGSPDDEADGAGDYLTPQLDQIGERDPSWVAWPGRWGDSSDTSPPGPRFQGTKWSNPSDWALSLPGCGTS